MCSNPTDVKPSRIRCSSSHILKLKVPWSTWSFVLLSAEYSKRKSSTDIYKKSFFFFLSDHEVATITYLTDSRSALRLRGLTTFTQRKWAGSVISGTWSKARRWPRLAWQESIRDQWGQCKNVLEKKLLLFSCASPKCILLNVSQTRSKETRKEKTPLENSLKI